MEGLHILPMPMMHPVMDFPCHPPKTAYLLAPVLHQTAFSLRMHLSTNGSNTVRIRISILLTKRKMMAQRAYTLAIIESEGRDLKKIIKQVLSVVAIVLICLSVFSKIKLDGSASMVSIKSHGNIIYDANNEHSDIAIYSSDLEVIANKIEADKTAMDALIAEVEEACK